MFAKPFPLTYTRPSRYKKPRVNKIITRATIDKHVNEHNSKQLNEIYSDKILHVLTFFNRKTENIYSIKEYTCDNTYTNYIIAFNTFDEAFRYKTLLEADTDVKLFIQFASCYEIKHACDICKYKCRVVNINAFVIPPTGTVDDLNWERGSILINEWGFD
tara:strand:+ start:1933 stop:2412 length:480 start_codon:yes stop_codon:yes gene_type:complete